MKAKLRDEFVEQTGINEIQTRLIEKHKDPTHEYMLELRRLTNDLSGAIFHFFDEVYYVTMNRDVLNQLFLRGDIRSGLHHFLGWGISEGRKPKRDFDLAEISESFLGRNTSTSTYSGPTFDELCDVLAFIEPQVLANCYVGQSVNLRPEAPRLYVQARQPSIFPGGEYSDRPWLALVMKEFDESYYEKISTIVFATKAEAFFHYLSSNFSVPANPNGEFDEAFYRSFYYDIGQAIKRGELISGFEHYIISGRAEGRLRRFSLVDTLDAVIPGVTVPRGLTAYLDIEKKIVPCPHRVDATRQPTVWIILPFLYIDIMFGGFASFLQFIECLIVKSVRIGIFIKDAPSATLDYFKYRAPNGLLTRCLPMIPVYSPIDGPNEFVFSPTDTFICYSNWDGLWGLRFAAQTKLGKPVFWIQEHEAIFFGFDARRFLMDSVYLHDHIGIFNSAFLRGYFYRQRIGKYKEIKFLERSSLSYEHVLQYNKPDLHQKEKRARKRRLLVYTRPEDHAARNLFEIAIVGLRLALQGGVFDDSWEFKGIGSLGGPYTVELGPETNLQIIPKMLLDEYRDFIQGVDIGISLMYAPHPSLLPYEIALTGAVVITNNFEERGPEFFSRFEGNIVSCDASVDEYVAAIRCAVERVSTPGYKKHLPHHVSTTWQDVFSDPFFAALRLIGLDFAEYFGQRYPE